MKNFIQAGDTITLPAPYAVQSGDGCKVNALFGVASGDAANGESVDLATTGVFALPHAVAATFDYGTPVFWDDTAKLVTATASGNTRIGLAVAPHSGGLISVKLN